MKAPLPIREHRHRLPLDCYQGRKRVTFTFCLAGRTPLFKDAEIIKAALDCLRQALNKNQTKNWAYVFLPDHLHCILEGESETANLWLAAVDFKQLSGFWLKQHRPGTR